MPSFWLRVGSRIRRLSIARSRRRQAWFGFPGQHRRQTIDPEPGITVDRRVSIIAAAIGWQAHFLRWTNSEPYLPAGGATEGGILSSVPGEFPACARANLSKGAAYYGRGKIVAGG